MQSRLNINRPQVLCDILGQSQKNSIIFIQLILFGFLYIFKTDRDQCPLITYTTYVKRVSLYQVNPGGLHPPQRFRHPLNCHLSIAYLKQVGQT